MLSRASARVATLRQHGEKPVPRSVSFASPLFSDSICHTRRKLPPQTAFHLQQHPRHPLSNPRSSFGQGLGDVLIVGRGTAIAVEEVCVWRSRRRRQRRPRRPRRALMVMEKKGRGAREGGGASLSPRDHTRPRRTNVSIQSRLAAGFFSPSVSGP